MKSPDVPALIALVVLTQKTVFVVHWLAVHHGQQHPRLMNLHGSISNRFCDSTIRSASLPGSRVPLICSSNDA